MSEEAKGVVTPQFIGALLDAAFQGAPPAVVRELVDADLCARLVVGSKLGVVVTVAGGPERVRVRVASDDEADRLLGVVREAAPALASRVEALGHGDVLYETDGAAWRVYVMGEGGRNDVGRVIEPDGTELSIVPQDGVLADAPAAIAGPARALASSVSGGTWFALKTDGQTRSLVWTSEGAWTPELDDAVAAVGTTPALAAARAVYTDAGLRVHPWSVEFGADGSVHVCLWGARAPVAGADLPAIFRAGVPDAAAFADEIAQTLPEKDQDAGRALVREQVYPALLALRPADVDPAEHAAKAWRFLLDVLAFEAPFDRLEILRRVGAVNRLAVLQRESFHLAVARHLATHDVPPPADLPDELAGLDAQAIRARAEALLDEARALAAVVEADPAADNHRLPGAELHLPFVMSQLERAVAGDFAAAEGPLYDYLVAIGPHAFDDDPSLVDVEHVDLEADRDAVLEEALARDTDES